jgi:CRISPR/Cas system-associated exonuclease Cas4 (RecB family)
VHAVVRAPSASSRIAHALDWLARIPRDGEVVVVGASLEAANELLRQDATLHGGRFGAQRTTLGRWAAAIASDEMARLGVTPVGGAALEAVCARVVHGLDRAGALGRLAAVADRPGLPRAVARTVTELRGAAVDPPRVADADLRRVLEAYESELARAGLVDRAGVLAVAARRLGELPFDLPVLLLDVAIDDARTQAFVAAVGKRSRSVLATTPAGDDRSAASLVAALGCALRSLEVDDASPLTRLQIGLFSSDSVTSTPGHALVVLSAPGESRECVEIARRLHREAEAGVAFDRMAVLVHAPQLYRAHLVEALRRAEIPSHFARGVRRPDPSGRALLALLACASEGLTATRFAEYLSLGECPDAVTHGAPPPAPPSADRWVPADEDLQPAAVARVAEALVPLAEPSANAGESEDAPVVAGTLRTPRLFERVLLDAAVIGGLDRWERRLERLRALKLEERRSLDDADEAHAERVDREIVALQTLQAWALPLLRDLAAFPRAAKWGEWIERLSALASRALRHPERVQSVLAELAPTADIGPVELFEVRLALERRLTEVIDAPRDARFGRVLVATPEEARGLSFDVVFLPGLAERLFPQKIAEDPLLLDAARASLDDALETNADRTAHERLALRIGVGAARRRVVASWPRLEIELARPRTPSFYALELVRAAEGALPGFDALARRADAAADARLGWPAPREANEAIDAAEHDLSRLDRVLRRSQDEARGHAAYLLGANDHLGRALRFRARRWKRGWFPSDGLMVTSDRGRAAIEAHRLARRSYSPTALQNYASCPYRFFLQAVHRLAPREVPVAAEELDPLQRGTLVHETQYELFVRLRAERLLPVREGNLSRARALLDEAVQVVVDRWKDDLAPAIDRLWDDAIAGIRADLVEWLRRTSEDVEWTPTHAELSFGLPNQQGRDPRSLDEPVAVEGLRLRGSIDLVEQSVEGTMRATDYKTGKPRAKRGDVIGGGETLQPVLYALALERIFPDVRIEGGRLWYCTTAGDWTTVGVPLDDLARNAVRLVASTIDGALAKGFLPAAPKDGACTWCDYQPICGPREELRVKRKRTQELEPLLQLRRHK